MLILLQHPLITHKLTLLRDRSTSTKEFRETLNEVSGLMAFEITRDLPLREVSVETPLRTSRARVLATEIVLVPVLRAGLGMVEGITNLVPTAKVGHIGLYRNEETLQPVTYYEKLPDTISSAMVLVLDPMLATGGSASEAIRCVKGKGASRVKLVSVVGAPEGVRRIENDHPDVDIYLAALDEGLNESGYIIPGLGDAGDRIFGTK
ncbi:MAG: uracil phosphoribosyltransferase [Bacteroidales bacterium]|nr:uracil phosphoribosyltransferase [Bacteroidales bacterium]MBN2697638.1 uracil phosphoribosyltransferase [Bacteroidales bacterium]